MRDQELRLSGAPALNFVDDSAAPGAFVTHDGNLAEVTAEDQWHDTPEDDEPPDAD